MQPKVLIGGKTASECVFEYSLPKLCRLGPSNYLLILIPLLQAYASVQLNADLGFSDSVYGTGAAIFFAGYMIFQAGQNHHESK